MSLFLTNKTNNENLVLTQDVLKEVAKRTGQELHIVEEIYKINIEYVKRTITDDSKIIIVSFPNLGKLRFNYYLGLCYMGRTKDYEIKTRVREKINHLREILKEVDGGKLKNFNKPIVYNSISYVNKKFTKNVFNNFYKHWKILEETHNENHQKYFK